MRSWLRGVIVCLVLSAVAGISGVVAAGELSGVVRGTFVLNPSQTPTSTTDVRGPTGTLDLDYTIGSVTFGLTPVLGPVYIGLETTHPDWWSGPSDIALLTDAHGRFGPFGFAANGWFDGGTATFRSGVVGGWIDLGGLELFGMAFCDSHIGYLINPYTGLSMSGLGLGNFYATGVGATFGAMGWLGDSTLSFEAGFNATDQSRLWIYNTTGSWMSYATKLRAETLGDGWLFPEGEMGSWNPFRLASCGDNAGFSFYVPQVLQTCPESAFEWVNVIATHRIGCIDVAIDVTLDLFSNQTPSFSAAFTARLDDALGLSWLVIEPTVTFTPAGKSVDGWLSLRVEEVGCVTPLFTTLFDDAFFGYDAPALKGFSLYGLHAEFVFGNVTLRAGSYFGEFRLDVFDTRGNLIATSHPLYGFSTTPPGYRRCAWPNSHYDEFIGILVNESGCCGGRSSGSIFVWFDDLGDDPSSWIFNIAEFDIDGAVGLSERLTLRGGLRLTEAEGLIDLLVGVDLAF